MILSYKGPEIPWRYHPSTSIIFQNKIGNFIL